MKQPVHYGPLWRKALSSISRATIASPKLKPMMARGSSIMKSFIASNMTVSIRLHMISHHLSGAEKSNRGSRHARAAEKEPPSDKPATPTGVGDSSSITESKVRASMMV